MTKPNNEVKYYHYCYVITDTKNGLKYFGVRSSELPPVADDKYMGSGTKITEEMSIHRALEGRKAVYDRFKKEILKVFDDRSDAEEFEEYYMVENDCVDSVMYYNSSHKSTGGRFDYHNDLKAGLTSSPQEKNGAQRKPGCSVETSRPLHADHTLNNDGSLDKRIHHDGRMGGKRPGAGPKKGRKAIYSKESVKKLEELDVDPMEELVRTYKQVCEDIDNTRSISARTALYNTRQKIMTDLMRYGYRQIPREDKQEVEVTQLQPMAIILTEEEE